MNANHQWEIVDTDGTVIRIKCKDCDAILSLTGLSKEDYGSFRADLADALWELDKQHKCQTN